jgi:acetoin:2,6-dichlorophenolindophenol oxidoreductase subunit alpha
MGSALANRIKTAPAGLDCRHDHLSECSPEELREMARVMTRIRLVEERIGELVAGGEIICPCHLYIGQEVVAAGVSAHLRPDDFVFSTHRSHGHYLAKGGDLKAMMAELFGRRTGCSRGKGGSMHLVAPEVGYPGSSAIVAGSIPLAVGAALGFQLRRVDLVAVAFFGDGAACEGAFYESLNFAALKKLPVVFVCENNFYSTHMPLAEMQAEPELYKKAAGFNLPGVRLDGGNLGEVWTTAREAVQRARQGHGPTLMECLTYRWRGHVGPDYDLDKDLRTLEELNWWMNRCGLKKLEEYLLSRGFISGAEAAAMVQEITGEIAAAVDFARHSPFPDKDDLYRGVFKGKQP